MHLKSYLNMAKRECSCPSMRYSHHAIWGIDLMSCDDHVLGGLQVLLPSRYVRWRFPLIFQSFFAIIVMVGLRFLPDSPRWLIMQG
jgi:hypothetical protein